MYMIAVNVADKTLPVWC